MKSSRGLVLAVLALGVSVGPAIADLTPVFAPPAGEMSHIQILDNIYGAGFAGGAGVFTNGTVTVTRVDDFLPGGGAGTPLHLLSNGPGLPQTDQIWTDGIANATAEAKFAAFSQEFGYDSGSGYVKLFDAIGSGFAVSGSGSVAFNPGTLWQWARSGQGGTWYSGESSNSDGLDHLVTYHVTGLNTTETVWLLFWEDLPGPLGGAGHSDRDFNDLVVELRASVIPIPGAVLMALVGFGVAGVIRRKLA